MERLRNQHRGMGDPIKRAQAQCSIAADTNSFTLSRQRENVAALGVVLHGKEAISEGDAQTIVDVKGAAVRRIRLRRHATILCCRLRPLSSIKGRRDPRALKENRSIRGCSLSVVCREFPTGPP